MIQAAAPILNNHGVSYRIDPSNIFFLTDMHMDGKIYHVSLPHLESGKNGRLLTDVVNVLNKANTCVDYYICMSVFMMTILVINNVWYHLYPI